jgi:DNA invertase Pin-like site-specific DNA recombinase
LPICYTRDMRKHNGKYVSYLRVSTTKQGVSGLGLDAQREAVRNWVNGGRWTLADEVVEVESGKRKDRPGIAEALRLCRLHNATLIIAKLDRLARNVHFISSLMESGVEFTACDFPQANRLTVHILAAVAEHEAKMISERTKAAMAVKREQLAAEGKKLGTQDTQRIKQYADQGRAVAHKVVQERARKRAFDLAPVLDDLRAKGITSKRGIARALNERGIETIRGGTWLAPQVARLLETLDKAQPAA